MADSDGLENRCPRKGTVGSNPTLSAIDSFERDVKVANTDPLRQTELVRPEGLMIIRPPGSWLDLFLILLMLASLQLARPANSLQEVGICLS